MDKQIKDQALLMKRTIRVAGLYLAITTAYTVWAMSAGFFPSLNNSLEWWLRVAACIGMYFFIDAGLSAQANYVFRGWIQKDLRKAAFFFLILTTLIFAVRFAATTLMTYVAAQPMATAIYSPPDNTDRRESILQAQSNTKATQDELKRGYDRLRQSERVRIADAKRTGKSLINDAINSENARVAQLYREKNDWVLTHTRFRKYRARIATAKQEADKLIKAEQDKTQAAQAAYMQALTGKDEITAVLAEDMKAANETYIQNKNSIAGAIYIVDFIAAFIMFTLSWVLALYEKKYQVSYENKFGEVWERLTTKYHEDVLSISEKAGMELWQFFVGLPLEKLTALFRWLKLGIWIKAIGAVENFFRIDINGDGKIGTPDSDKTATKGDNVAQMSQNLRPTISGFALNKKSDNLSDTGATNLATSAQNVASMSPDVATSEFVSFMSPLQTATNDTQKSDNAAAEKERQATSDKKRQALPARRKKTATSKSPTKAYIDKNRVAIKRAIASGDRVKAQAIVDKMTAAGYIVDIEPGAGLTIRRKGPKK